MWKFFNIGVVFFKNSTDLLLTQIIFYAIIPTIEECGRNIFILSVFALNGSCRNRAVQIPDFAYRNRQNQKEERVDSPQLSDTLGHSVRAEPVPGGTSLCFSGRGKARYNLIFFISLGGNKHEKAKQTRLHAR